MTFDWTLAPRKERYAFERLTLTMDRLGSMGGVSSCDLDWSIHNTIRGGGDLAVRTPQPIQWAHTLVRPWLEVTNRSGRVVVPLMTALCEVPDEDWTPAGVEVQVQLQDRTLILDQWLLADDYSLAAGTVITTAVRSIFATLGLTHVSITDSTATLASPKVWIASEGVSWLRVLNDLLSLIPYFSVWTDAMGWYQCHPYRPPSSRVASWRLADDGASHRYLGLKVSTGRPVPVNHWVMWSKAREAEGPNPAVEPMMWQAVNDDPEHPYSTVNLGRQVTAPPVVDVEGDVSAQVERAKAEAMANQRTLRVDARFLPTVEHEVVELVNRQAGVSVLASVAARSLSCTPGSKLALTLRKVG